MVVPGARLGAFKRSEISPPKRRQRQRAAAPFASLHMLRTFSRLRRAKAEPLEYPRLALYRSILRAHAKYLPPNARDLGDAYVKREFQLHRGASESFLSQFERQWRDYLTTLRAGAGNEEPIGRELTADEVAALSDEQKVQLLKIKENSAGPPSVG